jgi:hypothetical protein
VISVATVQQLVYVLFVDAKPLTLNVRTKVTAMQWTLVWNHSRPFQVLAQLFRRSLDQSRLVSVFYPQNESSILSFSEQVVEQGSSQTAQM